MKQGLLGVLLLGFLIRCCVGEKAHAIDCSAEIKISLKNLVQTRSEASLQKLISSDGNNRQLCHSCEFQIRNRLLPLHCYSLLGLGTPVDLNLDHLDQLCARWARKQHSAEALQGYSDNQAISRSCRDELAERKKILIYRTTGR